VDEQRRLLLDYSRPDKMMVRSAGYIIDKLSALSVYSVAVRARNGFGFSDWTPEFYFRTAPGSSVSFTTALSVVIEEI